MLSTAPNFRFISDFSTYKDPNLVRDSDAVPHEALKLEEGETIDLQSGAVLACKNVTIQTRMPERTLWQRIKNWLFGSENLFMNSVTAQIDGGWILLKEDFHHQVVEYKLSEDKPDVVVVQGAYLGASPNVELDTSFGGITGWAQGTGVFPAVAKLKASALNKVGRVFMQSEWGPVRAIKVKPGVPTIVDNDTLIGYTSGLHCSVVPFGNSITSLFLSKEAFVCSFSGEGYVFTGNHEKNHQVHHHHYYVDADDLSESSNSPLSNWTSSTYLTPSTHSTGFGGTSRRAPSPSHASTGYGGTSRR